MTRDRGATVPVRLALRILATSDLHAHLFAYDYLADRPDPSVGLVRTARLIEIAREESANCLLVDNGDFLQGTPLGDLYAQDCENGCPHPMIEAMNALGYDAVNLGNHEFNYGLPVLRRMLSAARFPVLASNLMPLNGEARLGVPHVLLDTPLHAHDGSRHTLRIGLFGVLPPQTGIWDKRHLEGRFTVDDIVASAGQAVSRLTRAGAEIVIALCHSGIGDDQPGTGDEHASRHVAALQGVDAVVMGHTHDVFPPPGPCGQGTAANTNAALAGTPAVMTGANGSTLGVIDLTLERCKAGWKVTDHAVENRHIHTRDPGSRPVATVSNHPGIETIAARGHRRTLQHIRQPVGRCDLPLHSYFSMVAPDTHLRLIADAQTDFVRHLLCGTEAEGLPVLSAVAPFRCGGHGGPENYTEVAAGSLTLRNMADLYLYPNALRAVCVTGAALKDWLEHAAAAFATIRPGSDGMVLLDEGFASYNFDVIHGITYRIDVSQPARFDALGRLRHPDAQRIKDLCHLDTPIRDEDRFIVATNTYRASGGGYFPGSAA